MLKVDIVKFKMWLKVIVIMSLFVSAPKNAVKAQSRIVGGFICNVTDYPFVVSVYCGFTCGGSVVTLRWVLTAAHCINQRRVKAGKGIVRAGYNAPSHYIQKRSAKLAVVHEKFDIYKMERQWPPELRYDIAMVLVKGSFQQSAVLKPVVLPKPGFTKSCTIGRAIGTGSEKMYRAKRGFMSRPLKCVDLHMTTIEICSRTFAFSVFDDTIVCTNEIRFGQDACQGDSGGPLMCYKDKSEGAIIGVVSAGIGCGWANHSATYTKVESYLDFINETIAKGRANLFRRLLWGLLSGAMFALIL